MQQLVKNAMDLGAFGLSTGPFYVPGKYSDTAELIAVAKAAAPYPYSFQTSHIRDEASYDIGLLAAVKELIEVSRQAKIKGVVTHIKAIGPDVWGKSKDVAKLIDDARKEGLDIWADQYAYGASSTGLSAAIVPGWAQEGGNAEIAKRIANPETRALMRKEMVDNIERRAGANSLMIRGYRPDPSLDGQRLDEIAKKELKEPVDVAIDLLSKGGAGVISFNMNEDDVETFMKQPWTMTSSDGGLGPFGVGQQHPRAYGAFPRKFRRYVIDKPVLTWEQAVHQSSGLTADVFHFDGRGYLKPGYFADVLVINPETIRDVSTYTKPHAYSVGMDYVFVNGQAAVAAGKVTTGHFGKVLLRQR
jgi:N-acyl-D-aspartate/D-glutamate deacylase